MMFGCFSKDETGIYKNLLQETAHRAGLDLPVYTSVRSGPGHIPTFSCTVELAGMSFNGEPAKTKKQAEKNAAIAAWFSLRKSTSKLQSPNFLLKSYFGYVSHFTLCYIHSAKLGPIER